jgi:hypothetical protein
MYLIGNSENYEEYLKNIDNINYLPLNNLPVVYFPFDYNTKESVTTLNIFSSVVDDNANIIEKVDASNSYNCHDNANMIEKVDAINRYNCDDKNKNVKCFGIKELYNSISILEEPWQPYNNNNIKTITNILIVFWLLVIFIILKILYYYFQENYSILMMSLISLTLLIGLIYALFLTNNKI